MFQIWLRLGGPLRRDQRGGRPPHPRRPLDQGPDLHGLLHQVLVSSRRHRLARVQRRLQQLDPARCLAAREGHGGHRVVHTAGREERDATPADGGCLRRKGEADARGLGEQAAAVGIATALLLDAGRLGCYGRLHQRRRLPA